MITVMISHADGPGKPLLRHFEEAAVIRKQRGGPYEALERISRAGQRDGSIRRYDAGELAVVFWTMIKGLAMQRLAFGKRFKAPDPRILTNIFFLESDK